ncbi:transglycosylase SLT domain-containing protein [Streptomyces sp. NPDC054841]
MKVPQIKKLPTFWTQVMGQAGFSHGDRPGPAFRSIRTLVAAITELPLAVDPFRSDAENPGGNPHSLMNRLAWDQSPSADSRERGAMRLSVLPQRATSKIVRYLAGGLATATVLLGASTAVLPTPASATPASAQRLDGWIKHALLVMDAKGIPGSYDGIRRNLMRESSGDPFAINLWDSNAAAGIPSKGLMQVIDPTFRTYHVDGTSWDIYDPIANIVAACNYAAKRYGSIDNVNGPY